MIVFEHVSKRYPGSHTALTDINFTLKHGEMVFLTGHSGAGKSTFLKLIALIERPSQGQILIHDKKVARLRKRQVPYLRRKMGIVFQDPQLLPNRSVFDNVALPLVIAGHAHAEVKRKVQAALDKVGLLHKAKQLPPALSTGEQQRVGIARAVVHKPPLLLADEPTGNLDPDLSTDIMNLFCEFNAVGVSVLVATHDLALIAGLPYRVLTLKQGHLLGGRHGQTEKS